MLTTKHCKICGQDKGLSDFYYVTYNDKPGVCIECYKTRVKANREANKEQYSAYEHERNLKRRDYMHEQQRKHRANNPEKYKAHTAVGNALRDGRLIRKPCEKCGNIKSQAHHPDYSKPIEVIWLCFTCHRKEHGQLQY
jgi:hypothetical protein